MRWLLGGVKTLSYRGEQGVPARGCSSWRRRLSVDEQRRLSAGGASSSVIAWIGDELVTTPTGATGILESITRTDVFARGPGRVSRRPSA